MMHPKLFINRHLICMLLPECLTTCFMTGAFISTISAASGIMDHFTTVHGYMPPVSAFRRYYSGIVSMKSGITGIWSTSDFRMIGNTIMDGFTVPNFDVNE